MFCSELTPDRNTEQTWLGEARNREVPPQALSHRRKRKGARDWHQRPRRGGARQRSNPERESASPRPSPPPGLAGPPAALRLRPSPARYPGALTPEEAAAPSSSLPLQAGDVGLTARSQKEAPGRARCPWSAVETGPSASRPFAAAVRRQQLTRIQCARPGGSDHLRTGAGRGRGRKRGRDVIYVSLRTRGSAGLLSLAG